MTHSEILKSLPAQPTLADLHIGQRVRVLRTAMTLPRISRLAEIALSSRGATTYVLEDGGWMDRSEITPA